MGLERKIIRSADITIEKAYMRISIICINTGVYIKTEGVDDQMFTTIHFDTYATKKIRDKFPLRPIESSQKKIKEWRPQGNADEQTSQAYKKLAELFNVSSTEV